MGQRGRGGGYMGGVTKGYKHETDNTDGKERKAPRQKEEMEKREREKKKASTSFPSEQSWPYGTAFALYLVHEIWLLSSVRFSCLLPFSRAVTGMASSFFFVSFFLSSFLPSLFRYTSFILFPPTPPPPPPPPFFSSRARQKILKLAHAK